MSADNILLNSTPKPAARSFAVIAFALTVMLFASSCFKEKNMQPPSDQSFGQIAVIPMTPSYENQFFFDLETNTVLKQNSRYAYDLLFDCESGQFNIWLNTAKMMSLKRTGKTSLDSVQLSDTLAGRWYYEFGAFNRDSSAIGNWWSGNAGSQPVSAGQVYLVQLGVDVNGYGLGFIKMQVNNFTGTTYSITFSDFVSPSRTVTVTKDDTRNYRYLTFADGGSLVGDIEPPKTDWDLCFTRYTVYFYAPYYIPYEVTGVLNNPAKVQAYMDSTLTFDSITIADFELSRLTPNRDAIGYEWKRYSTLNANGSYSMNPHYTYYIKADENEFYKLHFYAFEKDGVRGYPSAEYYRL